MSDLNKLADIFRGTIDPNERESAEKQLEMVKYFEFFSIIFSLLSSLYLKKHDCDLVHLFLFIIHKWFRFTK